MCLFSIFFSTVCFFLKYPATTDIYTYGPTLSLHGALPIYPGRPAAPGPGATCRQGARCARADASRGLSPAGRAATSRAMKRLVVLLTLLVAAWALSVAGPVAGPVAAQSGDRKSTRLNSSH